MTVPRVDTPVGRRNRRIRAAVVPRGLLTAAAENVVVADRSGWSLPTDIGAALFTPPFVARYAYPASAGNPDI